MKTLRCTLLTLFAAMSFYVSHAQETDSLAVEEEEDYSQYDNVTFADASAKRYCSPKIFDLSPQRFISLGWDIHAPYDIQLSDIGSFPVDGTADPVETGRVNFHSGLRIAANIPVISRNNVVWQVGANFLDANYSINEMSVAPDAPGILPSLKQNGLRTMGLNSTLFKPLGERQFLLFQGNADLSGDYSFFELQPLRYVRYSLAAIWGMRPNDRKMWGVGMARTYRVGEMNYIPVVLFNYTAPSRKWGTEILFPARAHVRRNFTPRSLVLAGYELEGQSYRLNAFSDADRSLEIRRGELRARVEYQRQLAGFVWITAQAGWRYNWSFNADHLPEGREFFRGFFGDQPFAMLNSVGNPLYLNFGIHLVSP